MAVVAVVLTPLLSLQAAVVVPRTTRVSVASNGHQGDNGSGFPVISEDGRFVAFESSASNLVPHDNSGGFQRADVFVHDRLTGRTERASVASNGAEGDASSGNPAISATGRFVAFVSGAK